MTLEEFRHHDTIRTLLSEGFISSKISRYIEMYQYYQAKIITGAKKTPAITSTADDFRVSEITVYAAIKKVQALELAIKDSEL